LAAHHARARRLDADLHLAEAAIRQREERKAALLQRLGR
jgi:hypothetical protein